jgi:hypothetical protein
VPRRSPSSRCDRIAELAQTLAPLLEGAADAGARRSGSMEFVGRGRGFTDADPTGTAALDPRRSQIRRAAHRATQLIEEAEATLEEASDVIANGYLRLDPQEWIRAVEKRRAALRRLGVLSSSITIRGVHGPATTATGSAAAAAY